MNELGTNQLFELARNAPTELSNDQVVGIIQTLPTLPTGGSWFKNFNLNSIIMTTTTVTIISSALIYFLGATSEPEVPGQDVQVDQPEILVQDSLQNEISEPIIAQPESTSEDVIEDKQTRVNTSIKESQENGNKPLEVAESNADSPPSTPKEVANSTSGPPSVITKEEVNATDEPMEELSLVEKDLDPAAIRLSNQQFRKLKRKFLKYLDQDNFRPGQKALNVLTYSTTSVTINNHQIDEGKAKRYVEMLNDYGILPKPQKMVVMVHPDYIMVGQFTDQGFKGQAHGKNMNIEFLDDQISAHDLLEGKPVSSIASIPQPTLFNPAPDSGPQKGITPGSISKPITTAKTNRGKLFESSDPLTNREEPSTTPRKPSRVFKNKDSKAVKLNAKTIKQFKKELYQNLVSDDLIKSRKSEVKMLIESNLFHLNGVRLDQVLTAKYERLLNRYSVEQARDHRILMSPDFIFVGKFMKDRFTGTIQGDMNRSKISGGILEDDLMKLSIFDGRDHVNTKDGVKLSGKFSLSATSANSDKSVTKEATEERNIAEFHSLEVSGVAVVYYSTGAHKKARLVVRGMPINDVLTRVKDGVLMVDTRGNPQGESIEVYVSSPYLRFIEVRGAGEIYTENAINSESLIVSTVGAGAAFLEVDVNSVHIDLKGGDLEIVGSTKYKSLTRHRDSDRGTLDDRELRVEWKDADPVIDKAIKNGLQSLRTELQRTFIGDKLIASSDEEVTVSFSKEGLNVNGKDIPESRMNEYRGLLAKYDVLMREDRKIFIKAPKIILMDRNQGVFRSYADGGGEKVYLTMKDNWKDMERAFFSDN